MKALIYKDLLNMASYKRTFIMLFFIFVILAFQNNEYSSFMAMMFVIMSTVFSISSFSYDDISKWDTYALTFPITKKDIVKSKYALALLLLVISTVGVVIVDFIIMFIKSGDFSELTNILSVILGTIMGISVLVSVLIPAVYKFGAEKGRIIMMALVFMFSIIFGGVAILVKDIIDYINFITLLERYGIILAVAAVVVMLYLSYKVSCKIYINKEF